MIALLCGSCSISNTIMHFVTRYILIAFPWNRKVHNMMLSRNELDQYYQHGKFQIYPKNILLNSVMPFRIIFYLPFWSFLYRRLQMHHDQSGLLIYTRIFRQIPSWWIYYELEESRITTVAIYCCQKSGFHQLNTTEIRLYA